jgi:hypothetical protein
VKREGYIYPIQQQEGYRPFHPSTSGLHDFPSINMRELHDFSSITIITIIRERVISS